MQEWAAVCVAGAMLVAGCGGKSGPSVLDVKGLSLGMGLSEANAVCKTLLEGSGCSVGDIQDGELAIYDIGESGGKCFGFSAMGMNLAGGGVTADANGKVNGFIFSGGLVNHIFKVTEMEDGDFVQKFADSYKIPEFKVSDANEFWYFDSPHGYRIKIKQGKGLTVKKIASANEQKFN